MATEENNPQTVSLADAAAKRGVKADKKAFPYADVHKAIASYCTDTNAVDVLRTMEALQKIWES